MAADLRGAATVVLRDMDHSRAVAETGVLMISTFLLLRGD